MSNRYQRPCLLHRPWAIAILLTCATVFFSAVLCAEALTLPLDERPDWLARDGIVMAGSWEPLLFRVRRDGSDGYTPTAEQLAAYRREHSAEMVARLKELGINFVMMHCHKGAGLEAERESMADAVAFAKLCHEAGLRVGVYTYSGAFLWELLFKEAPEAKDWVVHKEDGQPHTYGRAQYRYYWNRNHPDAQAYYRKIVRFAVEDIKTDLLHFDNYSVGPGSDANSVARFRRYLADTFAPERLEALGFPSLDTVQPPMSGPPDTLLRRAWLNFSCQSLADSYLDMGRYARTLRKDILVECNPGGVGGPIRTPVDHGRLLAGGEAFWDESLRPGFRDGKLATRIRTFKVARRMDNIAFNYTTSPLEAAEAMAFNRDCLGCVCWFEYGDIVERPGFKKPMPPALLPYIRFFHKRRPLLRDAGVVADVAVLRSFPSQVLADPKHAALTHRVEELFIEHRVCFQIIYDQHLAGLSRYRALVLAGCVALSERQIAQIQAYVEAGGRLCLVGPAATHDEWMLPRQVPAFDGLAAASVVQINPDGDILNAVSRACDDAPTLAVHAEPVALGLCTEVTEQPGRRLVHLVNYREDAPFQDVQVRLRLPAGRTVRHVALASPGRETDLELPFEVEEGFVDFRLPEVCVYEIAMVSLESR